jgi:hypothetical protein
MSSDPVLFGNEVYYSTRIGGPRLVTLGEEKEDVNMMGPNT